MFEWLFGRKKETPQEPPRRPGFFSTDFDLKFDRKLNRRNAIQDGLRMAFPRTVEDMKPSVMNSEGTGMDSAFSITKPSTVGLLDGNIPEMQFLWYASQSFIGYQVCAIIAQNWLVEKACAMPGRDAVRHGWELATSDDKEITPEQYQEIRRLDKGYSVKRHLTEFVKMGRVFGIRILLFKYDNVDYAKPFNADGIKKGSYRGMVQIDPYWITPLLDGNAAANPAAPDFYEPTWWQIQGVRYHRSHLMIYRTGELADILKPAYLYGSVSVPQKISERIYAAERTANEAPQLALTKRTNVMKVDLAAAMGNIQKLQSKVELWSWFRDNFGVKIVDTQEEIEQFDTALGDMDDLIMTQYQLVAACADVPATKLLGTTPKGFQSTGEYDSKSYHEFLETIQENDMTPVLERHYLCMTKSEGIDLEIEVSWNAVDSPGAKEQADTNFVKSQTAKNYSDVGALDGQDIRDGLIKDKDSGYNGITPDAPDPMEDLDELPADRIKAALGGGGSDD